MSKHWDDMKELKTTKHREKYLCDRGNSSVWQIAFSEAGQGSICHPICPLQHDSDAPLRI